MSDDELLRKERVSREIYSQGEVTSMLNFARDWIVRLEGDVEALKREVVSNRVTVLTSRNAQKITDEFALEVSALRRENKLLKEELARKQDNWEQLLDSSHNALSEVSKLKQENANLREQVERR